MDGARHQVRVYVCSPSLPISFTTLFSSQDLSCSDIVSPFAHSTHLRRFFLVKPSIPYGDHAPQQGFTETWSICTIFGKKSKGVFLFPRISSVDKHFAQLMLFLFLFSFFVSHSSKRANSLKTVPLTLIVAIERVARLTKPVHSNGMLFLPVSISNLIQFTSCKPPTFCC